MPKYQLARPSWKHNNDSDRVGLAKKYPIEKMYVGKLRRVGQVLMGLCIAHEEKTPSMAIYKNNTWHCFSCNAGNDAIDFYQKLHGVDFKTATEELTK